MDIASVTSNLAAAVPNAAQFDLPRLVLQVGVVVASARVMGWAFRRLGQPAVIGEMAAGILLGPSLFGWIAPAASSALFPPDSLGYLQALSQLGLILFMFLVGVEVDLGALRRNGTTAVACAAASIVVPFSLGVALAISLFERLAPPGVSFTGFALFVGAAMSVTAFPVLARILADRGLMRTDLGAIAIACAAIGDLLAWCILAAIVVLVRSTSDGIPVWATVAGSSLWIVVMLTVVRPAFRAWDMRRADRPGHSTDIIATGVVIALVSAWVTESLGVHALLGAFLAGTVVPRRPQVTERLRAGLEPAAVVVLMPLFFALTGLQTSIGLLVDRSMWMDCALIVTVAVVGKIAGSAFAGRLTGMAWRDGVSLGVLMNTRGLMELVILSVGLEIGAISRALYTMMVVMALATTLMTTPLLAWLKPGDAASRRDNGTVDVAA